MTIVVSARRARFGPVDGDDNPAWAVATHSRAMSRPGSVRSGRLPVTASPVLWRRWFRCWPGEPTTRRVLSGAGWRQRGRCGSAGLIAQLAHEGVVAATTRVMLGCADKNGALSSAGATISTNVVSTNSSGLRLSACRLDQSWPRRIIRCPGLRASDGTRASCSCYRHCGRGDRQSSSSRKSFAPTRKSWSRLRYRAVGRVMASQLFF